MAHGPEPGVVGLVRSTGGRLDTVRLTEGLALRQGDGWRYVCPVQFGDALSPDALAAEDGDVYVVGSDGLLSMDGEGSVRALDHPGLSRDTVLDLTSSHGSVYGLRYSDDRSELVRLDASDATVLWSHDGFIQSLNADGERLWLTSTVDGTATLHAVTSEGESLQQRTVAVDRAGVITRVVQVLDALYAIEAQPSGNRLLRLPDVGDVPEVVYDAGSVVYGPIAEGAAGWFVADGMLMSLDNRTPGEQPVDAEAAPTALWSLLDETYLVSYLQVFRFDRDGVLQPEADLRQLQPPDLTRVEDALQSECSNQWTTASRDIAARWGGGEQVPTAGSGGATAPEPQDTEPTGAHGGCTAVTAPLPARVPQKVVALAALAGLVRRRNRQRPR